MMGVNEGDKDWPSVTLHPHRGDSSDKETRLLAPGSKNKALETVLNVNRTIERGKDTARKLIPLSLQASALLSR